MIAMSTRTKRLFDVVGAIGGLIVFAPPLAAVGAARLPPAGRPRASLDGARRVAAAGECARRRAQRRRASPADGGGRPAAGMDRPRMRLSVGSQAGAHGTRAGRRYAIRSARAPPGSLLHRAPKPRARRAAHCLVVRDQPARKEARAAADFRLSALAPLKRCPTSAA